MDTSNIKTAYDLKYAIEQAGTENFYFTRKTMKFFGDTMRNYGVRRIIIDTYTDKGVKVFELYRRRPVKYNNQESAYFDCETLERRFPC